MNNQRDDLYKRTQCLVWWTFAVDILTMLGWHRGRDGEQRQGGWRIREFQTEFVRTFKAWLGDEPKEFDKMDAWNSPTLCTVMCCQSLRCQEQSHRTKNRYRSSETFTRIVALPSKTLWCHLPMAWSKSGLWPTEKSVDTNNVELVKRWRRSLPLSIIDQQWKEHLRDMDDLKQSRTKTRYEQKDLLIISGKSRGLRRFKRFIGRVNSETIGFWARLIFHQNKSRKMFKRRTQRRQRSLNRRWVTLVVKWW